VENIPPSDLRDFHGTHSKSDRARTYSSSSSAIAANWAINGLRRVLSHARQTWFGPMSETATWTMSGRV
jgi:hypothetical protein